MTYIRYHKDGAVHTTALCPKCGSEVPGSIDMGPPTFALHAPVWLNKECPACGPSSAMVERSAAAYISAASQSAVLNPAFDYYYVDVTSRCNAACGNCYAGIDNASSDKPAEAILADAKMGGSLMVVLSGGEPTMREDLGVIVKMLKGAGHVVGIMTNGIKLSGMGYAAKLKSSGLDFVSMSIHGNDRKDAVASCRAVGLHVIGNFTVNGVSEVPAALEKGAEYGLREIRIRSAFRIGKCESRETIFLSDMGKALISGGCTLDASGHHVFHVSATLGEMKVYGIVLPDADTIDLGFTNMNPRMRAKDGIVRHLTHSFIVNERMGGWRGVNAGLPVSV